MCWQAGRGVWWRARASNTGSRADGSRHPARELDGRRSVAAALQHATVAVAQLEIPLDAVRAAARHAAGRFVLNPAPARPLDADLLDRVDVLVVNEGEFSRVTGVEVGCWLARRLPYGRVT